MSMRHSDAYHARIDRASKKRDEKPVKKTMFTPSLKLLRVHQKMIIYFGDDFANWLDKNIERIISLYAEDKLKKIKK